MINSFRKRATEEEEDVQARRYLIFLIGEEKYGIEIHVVSEIINMQKITPVPETHPYIKGIINLRGKIVPVMDVRLRFQREEAAYNDRTCVVVVEMEGVAVGLIVDNVTEVIGFDKESIVPPPEFATGGNRFVQGVGKAGEQVVLLLDCDMLLNDKDKELVAEVFQA